VFVYPIGPRVDDRPLADCVLNCVKPCQGGVRDNRRRFAVVKFEIKHGPDGLRAPVHASTGGEEVVALAVRVFAGI